MPKSDVRLVIVVVIGLLTWFFYTIQFQKYQRAVKYLKDGTLKKLSLKEGGSKQTLELYRRATDIYMEEIETCEYPLDKRMVWCSLSFYFVWRLSCSEAKW